LLGEDLFLMKIAQRFAAGAQTAGVPEDLPLDHQRPGSAFAVLSIVALLPGIALGAMIWIGLNRTPATTQLAPQHNEQAEMPVQSASVAAIPGDQLKQAVASRPVVLTVPLSLEGKAGEDVAFPIKLGGSEALPVRSSIAIGGLPQGSRLSSGRRYGEGEWNLRPDEIGDLNLLLPDTASGDPKITINIIDSLGGSIANAETALKIVADARVAEPRNGELGHFAAVGPYFDVAGQDGGDGASPAGSRPIYEPLFAPRYADYVTPEILNSRGSSDKAAKVEAGEAESKPQDPEAVTAVGHTPQLATEEALPSIEVSEFVNLRTGPSSSSPVVGVMTKGSKVHPIARKRGWLKVTNPATSETGWIYARYAATSKTARPQAKQAVPSRVGPGSNESIWTRLGQWLTGD